MRGLGWSAAVAGALVAAAIVGASAQAPAGRPRITGIDHVVIRVSDAAAARRFYGDVLGLRGTSERVSGRATALRLRYDVGTRQTIYVDVDLPAGEDERLSSLAFATPDLQALAAHLTAHGVSVIHMTGPLASIVVTDPDGHPIVFVERPWPVPDRSLPPVVFRGTKPLSTRLLHAGLTVRDEAAANRFYKDVLGFSEIWRGGRTDGATDWVNMRVPDGTDYLEYMLVASPPDRRQRGVLHHVALLVPDIQAAWEAVGARVPAEDRARTGPPNVGRNGRWQLNLYDGDGTRTELMEPFTVR
jgi:catechol 2,3-dioxygenase-like lactoylglutathione lyase family enzyme